MHMKYGLSLLQNRLSSSSMVLHCLVFNNWAETRVIIRFLITEEIAMGLQLWKLSLESWDRHHVSMGENILHAVSLEYLPKHSLHQWSSMQINYSQLLFLLCPCYVFPPHWLWAWSELALLNGIWIVVMFTSFNWAETFNVLAWFGPASLERYSGWQPLRLGPWMITVHRNALLTPDGCTVRARNKCFLF